jgi:hypothetical protein
MATGSGWIKVGRCYVNLGRADTIDTESERIDHDEQEAGPQSCVTVYFGYGNDGRWDETNLFGEEAAAIRAYLQTAPPSNAVWPTVGPLGAIDVLAWYAAEVKAEPPAFQIGG